MELHTGDVIITDPIRVGFLDINDVIQLPVPYGESKVMTQPLNLPRSNAQLVFFYVECDMGMKRIVCAKNQDFQLAAIEI